LDESKGHFEEGAHLIELISGYNELVSTKLILSEEKALDVNYIFIFLMI